MARSKRGAEAVKCGPTAAAGRWSRGGELAPERDGAVEAEMIIGVVETDLSRAPNAGELVHWHGNLKRVWWEEKELLSGEEVEQWQLECTKKIVKDAGRLEETLRGPGRRREESSQGGSEAGRGGVPADQDELELWILEEYVAHRRDTGDKDAVSGRSRGTHEARGGRGGDRQGRV